MNELDQLGVPGLLVASEAFQTAAVVQSKSLGFATRIIWVAHPIQNRTADELHDIARAACQPILVILSEAS